MTSRSDSSIKLARHQFCRKLEKEYEQLFPFVRAPGEFFERLSEIDKLLTKAWAKRPITDAEIDSLGLRAYKRLRVAMIEHAGKTAQPDHLEATNIVTGEVRLI